MLKLSASLLSLTALLACSGGGGGSDIETVTVTPTTSSNAGLDFDASRNATTGAITFDPDPATPDTLVFTPTDDLAVDGFQVLTTPDGSSRYLRNASENGLVVAVIASDTSMAEGFNGSIITRTIDGELPVSGSASYTGDYAAFIVDSPIVGLGDIVTGTAQIDVDFNVAAGLPTNTTGTITDRVTDTGVVLAHLELIDGSSPSIGLIFGQLLIADNDLTAGSGSFSALVNGPVGEVAGAVTVLHTIEAQQPFAGDEFQENGGFLATQD